MTEHSPLVFKVHCDACYGEETWKLPRIVRLLTELSAIEVSEENPYVDLEFIAEQFAKFSKQMTCPGCGKTGTLKVRRISL